MLTRDGVSSEAYLGVGALAGKFCKEHACDKVPEIDDLEVNLAVPLMDGCRTSSRNAEDQVSSSFTIKFGFPSPHTFQVVNIFFCI